MQPPAGAKVGERVMAEGEAQLDHAGSSFDDFSSHFPSPNWSRQSGLLVSPHSSLYFHIVHILSIFFQCNILLLFTCYRRDLSGLEMLEPDDKLNEKFWPQEPVRNTAMEC